MQCCSEGCFKSDAHAPCRHSFPQHQAGAPGREEGEGEEKACLLQLVAKYRRDCLLDEFVRDGSTALTETEVLEAMGEDGQRAFYAALPKMVSDYTPWFAKDPCVPPCGPLPSDLPPLSTISKKPPSPLVWFNLIDVLYWYCCLQRKDLGDAPDEIELIDASPVLSGMTSAYSSMDDCMAHIRNAMHYFFPQEAFRSTLFACSLSDLRQLLAFSDRPLMALCHLYTVTCKTSQKQAHGLRLYYLLVWLRSQPATGRLAELAAML